MFKVILIYFILFAISVDLAFAQEQTGFFVIKNSKITSTAVNGQQQQIYQGDIEISNDSKDTYMNFADQKIKINLDFSELLQKNANYESQSKDQGLEAFLFNQTLTAIQTQPYIYLKQIFGSWHQSTIAFSLNPNNLHEIKLSEMLIQNTTLMKNDRFLSFEKILIQLTLHHFSTKNLQQTADRLTALVDLKVEKTEPPVKKQFGFVHSKDSPKDVSRLSTIGFIQSSTNQAATQPLGYIGFIKPTSQCRLLFK